MKYRPEIDGLRTFAVFPVILFHLGYGFITGGYYGVDVFFVISGFLITTILTKKIVSGEFSMFDFWIRRIKRLFPLLITVVILTLIFARIFIFKPYIVDIARDTAPAIFSYFNFHALYDFGDYWGSLAEKSFFLHTWSLSVEEQFYLIYPFFLFFVYKYFKTFLIPLLLLTGISFLAFIFYIRIDRQFVFFMIPTRIWELSAGGIISVIPRKNLNSKFTKNLIPIIGIFLISCAYLFASKKIDYWVVLPVSGTLIILMYCSTNDLLGKILSTKPLVYIGKLSYSIYLWHWPIIVFFNSLEYQFQDYNRRTINFGIIVLTLIFSILSYHFIENKSRNYKYTPKIVLVAIIIIMGVVSYLKSDLFNIHYKSNFKQIVYSLDKYDIAPSPPKRNELLSYKVKIEEKNIKYKDAYKNEGIITKYNNENPRIVIFGDSHGAMWGQTIDDICNSSKVSHTFYTSNATKPFINFENLNIQKQYFTFTKAQRIEYAKSLKKNLDNWKPILFIIICKWEKTLDDNEIKNDFLQLLNYAKKNNIKLLILNQPPTFDFMVNENSSQYFSYLGISPNQNKKFIKTSENGLVLKENNNIYKISKKYGITYFDVYNKLRINNENTISYNRDLFYFDDDHLSVQGTEYFKDDLKKVIISQLK